MTKRSFNSLQRKFGLRAAGSDPKAHAHKMVAETAAGLAGALYEKVMQSNIAFDEWKLLNSETYTDLDEGAHIKTRPVNAAELERRFIKLMVPKLLGEARATLARMLTQPIDEGLKESIHEALVLDNTLRRGRVGVPTLAQDGNYEPTASR